jgi:hypothetical protein
MAEQSQETSARPASKRGYFIFLAVLFGIGAIATTGLVLGRRSAAPDELPKGVTTAASGPTQEYKAFAGKYLRTWPTDRIPEMILVFSGQEHNYEAPCGCTEPQSGGLERRYNFLSQIRGFGVPTVVMDLGDIYSTSEISTLREQAKLKYFVSMKALATMQYDAVNIGPEEFRVPLLDAASFLLNYKTPFGVLAANIANKNDAFPGVNDNSSVFEDFRVIQPKGGELKIGVTGTLGQSAIDEIVKYNPSLDPKMPAPEIRFAGNSTVIPNVLAAMKAKSPDIRVLLYQGTKEEAEKLAQVIDEFDIILYRTDQSDPPSQAERAKAAPGKKEPKAQLMTVGHKGRWMGVMGVFRNPDKSLELQWEVVLLNPDFKSPAANREKHPVVKLLEDYTKKLRDNDFLAKYVKAPLPTINIGGKELRPKYLGSEACKACHAKEFEIWDSSRHAGAYETLIEKAKYPENRQFDGECVVCHTVGFRYSTGFRDNAAGLVNAEKSKHLFGVGCENCHGAGSLHAADPKNVQLRAAMSPWKSNPNDHLTKLVVEAEKMSDSDPRKKTIPAADQTVALRVFQTCSKCHDTDNDHDYNLGKWKKIAHGSAWEPEKK